MADSVITALIVAAATGFVSTILTVLTLRVGMTIHIEYIKEHLLRIDEKATHAHRRIDDVEKFNQAHSHHRGT